MLTQDVIIREGKSGCITSKVTFCFYDRKIYVVFVCHKTANIFKIKAKENFIFSNTDKFSFFFSSMKS